MNERRRLKKICSDKGLSIKQTYGEDIFLIRNKDGVLQLKSAYENLNESILDMITLTDMTPEEAAAKKKGFWRRLWNKVKKVAGDVLDAVTVPVFGYRCRPNASISFNPPSFTLGVSCVESVLRFGICELSFE